MSRVAHPPAEPKGAEPEGDEDEVLAGFVEALRPTLPQLLDRLRRYANNSDDSGVQRACEYLDPELSKACSEAGGLIALASQPRAPELPLSQHTAFMRGMAEYLHAAMFLFREQAFNRYGETPQRCRLVLDLLDALFHRLQRQLGDELAQAAATAAVGEEDRDPATGLPGRKTFLQTLKRKLDQAQEHPELHDAGIAVAVIEVEFAGASAPRGDDDDDRQGVVLSHRIRGALRPADGIGRLGRKSFGVLLADVASAEVALLAADRIRTAIEADLLIDGVLLAPRSHIGVALFPEHADNAPTLLQHAEVAQESARASDDALSLYDPAAHRESRRRLSLEARLRAALNDNLLELHFQPKADLRSGRVVGAEALLRWRADAHTWIPPGEMVALAEHSRQQSALSFWVINTAARQLSELRAQQISIDVSVNITAQNLLDPELPDYIEQALATWRLAPRDFIIELTEQSMIGDSDRAIQCLHRLKSLGLRLSIDDFGTGYSSLSYLTRMPIDELKIDQAFTKRMLKVEDDARIVRSIIDLARHFRLKVVAEGVEDLATAQWLRELGCEGVQGFLVSAPLSTENFAAWWHQHDGYSSELLRLLAE